MPRRYAPTGEPAGRPPRPRPAAPGSSGAVHAAGRPPRGPWSVRRSPSVPGPTATAASAVPPRTVTGAGRRGESRPGPAPGPGRCARCPA